MEHLRRLPYRQPGTGALRPAAQANASAVEGLVLQAALCLLARVFARVCACISGASDGDDFAHPQLQLRQ